MHCQDVVHALDVVVPAKVPQELQLAQQPPADCCGISGTGYHGYWAQDWYAIDPHFGSAVDLRELSQQLHARGMCLMLDIVTNHVRPIMRGAADVARVRPFDRVEHYHTPRMLIMCTTLMAAAAARGAR